MGIIKVSDREDLAYICYHLVALGASFTCQENGFCWVIQITGT